MIQLTPHTPSVRAQLVARRTYQRPLNAEGTVFETWEQTVDRVIGHQKWLWERARGGQALEAPQLEELEVLRHLIVNRAAFMSGRTMWLGGTDVARRREASMVNCSFLRVETVYDVVDAFWLLLQGAGVGFEPVVGSLNGFPRPLEIQTIRSARMLGDGLIGHENNVETVVDGVWTIRIGDSAEAWAKSVGKILAGKRKAHTLVLDFSEIRAAGSRLGGYGWISSGDGPLHEALLKICDLMNSRIDSLMTRINILDLMNLLGTTLSSRRSAQIALMPAGDTEADEFAMAKKDCFTNGKHHRGQSNNSVMFSVKPSVAELRGLFATMEDAGGSEPGFINMTSAKVRAPWVSGFNPCAEQCLANKGVCNLSELVLTRFPTRTAARAAIRILARANYRQTCINLDDGILQRSWHEVNDHLHLCGVGLTGISQWQGSVSDPASALRALRMAAQVAAEDMADELGLARPKHVTTTKPSGTLSKVADCSEGVHDALGEYIVNTIMLSAHDPLVGQLQAANYRVRPHPQLQESMLVEVPIHFPGATGVPATAIQQLERYRMMMENYVDSNCSITVSYGQDEVRDICAWLYANWDLYVGVSFMPRIDATKTAEELGYSYLPQAVITREVYEAYASTLLPVDLDAVAGNDLLGDDCAGGVCPVR